MKKAIFTLAIGDNPMYQAALLSFQHYASKVGAELIVSEQLHYPIHIHKPRYNANPAWAEKLRIGELLKTYDRVLYVDSDILIHPDADNIFSEYPELDTVFWFNEGQVIARDSEVKLIEDCFGKVSWGEVQEKPTYYNAGVILASSSSSPFLKANLEDLNLLCNNIKFYEQTYFNYLLHKHQLKHQSLDKRFNRMDMFGKTDYLKSDFIHYAGKGYAKNNRRRDVQFLRDFALLYSSIVEAGKIAELKARVWQQYLDKIYRKYPLPKPLLRALCHLYVPR
ncbi:glycosyltransferase [Pseudoalteromonas fenneropenaei]|uniref:Glycosyltransferase n=1 Tax=Pseudoalteromonas fenneropenaei TaxID=1737459 RepID=A0ABV7CPL2_9GAMM